MSISKRLSPEVRAVAREAIELRRRFHAFPEGGFQEKKTAGIVRSFLKREGIPFKPMAGTGTAGLIRGRGKGKTLLIRADMDALPLEERNKVSYRSRNPGFMHACGHDAHVAILLAAARLLRKRRDRLNGIVKLMFQPAEEGPGGAKPMIDAGILENPGVDAAVALHVWNELPTGKVGVRDGSLFASVDEFTAVIEGRGGHGAAAHLTIDPVVVAAEVILALQTVVSRKVEAVDPAVVTVGQIHGGTRANIIPDSVAIDGTVRSFKKSTRGKMQREIKRIMQHVCRAHGAVCRIDYRRMYPTTDNDASMNELARKTAASFLGKGGVLAPSRVTGAEDMAYVLKKVPGCFLLVGSMNRKKGKVHPHHSPLFDIDEDAIPVGIEWILRLTEQYLG